jgi:diketogulonate reductase-like aldo/keto reductase
MDLPVSNITTHTTVYTALEALYNMGVIRAIGVANCDLPLLTTLFDFVKILPHVVQNKIDIYHIGKTIDAHSVPQQEGLLDITALYGIAMSGYAPLSGYPFVLKPIDDPIVRYYDVFCLL